MRIQHALGAALAIAASTPTPARSGFKADEHGPTRNDKWKKRKKKNKQSAKDRRRNKK